MQFNRQAYLLHAICICFPVGYHVRDDIGRIFQNVHVVTVCQTLRDEVLLPVGCLSWCSTRCCSHVTNRCIVKYMRYLWAASRVVFLHSYFIFQVNIRRMVVTRHWCSHDIGGFTTEENNLAHMTNISSGLVKHAPTDTQVGGSIEFIHQAFNIM